MGCKGLLESELKLQKLSGRRCVEFSLVSPYSGIPNFPIHPCELESASENPT